MPDGKHVTSTHTCELLLPTLPPAARKAHVFPDFPTGALLSIGLLCDHGCTAHLDKNSMVIIRNNTIVLKGTRSPSSPVWTVDPPTTVPTSHQTPQLHANIATHSPPLATLQQRIAFLHAALCNPALSTLCDALDAGYLTSWPELTSKLVRNYPPPSRAMMQGHLDQRRRNAASTQPQPQPPPIIPATATPTVQTPTTEPRPIARTHALYAFCIPSTGKIFTDQTGRMPIRSTSGNSDLLVLYDYDSNCIHAEAMPSRT